MNSTKIKVHYKKVIYHHIFFPHEISHKFFFSYLNVTQQISENKNTIYL